MPKHQDTKHLPYSAQQIFDLVADIESYPKFLPWNAAARIRSREAIGDQEVILADLMIAFKVFREKFGSKVTLMPNDMRIETEYLDGPFRYMKSWWRFEDVEEGGCNVTFFVDFEFKSALLQSVIGVVFNDAMRRVMRAFERRAAEIYG